MLHTFFRFAIFPCCTFFSCCTLFMLHLFCVAFCSWCTLFVFHFFTCSFMSHSFLVALFPFFTIFTLYSFDVAPFFELHVFFFLFFFIYFFILQHFHPELFSRCTLFMSHLFVMLGSCTFLLCCCTFFLLYIFSCSTLFILQFFHVALFQFRPLLCFTLSMVPIFAAAFPHTAHYSHCTLFSLHHVAPISCCTFSL